jgi:hypothetical protein
MTLLIRGQTEQDFAEIAGAGLNHVRISLPYWAIETRDGEPFLAKTAWTYVLDYHNRVFIVRLTHEFKATS